MRMFKENAILSEIAKDKRLNEDFWNPGKYFQLLQDMENIDAEKWNNANSQAERDEMVRPFLQEFWNKYKEEMTEEDIQTLFDDMEDSNYHTEYRVLQEIIYGKNDRLKGILKDLAGEYETAEEITDALRSLEFMGEISDSDYNIIQANWDEWLNESSIINESNGLVDDECLEYLGLVHDDLNMISTFEDDSIKFKLADIDTLICFTLELKKDATNLLDALRAAKSSK